MSEEADILSAYRAALASLRQRAVIPFTTPYGRELKLGAETLLIAPWLEVAEVEPALSPSEDPAQPPDHRSEPRRSRLLPLLQNHGPTGLVVLGEPGAGKTTLAYQLASTSHALVPIIVPATAYAAHLADAPDARLPDVAATHWQAQGVAGLAPIFDAALSEGRAMIILDGLDEGGSRAQRRAMATRIVADMTRWRSTGNLWLFTSRPYGYNDAPLPDPAITSATLCAWSPDQIRDGIRGWCHALACWQRGGEVPADDPDLLRHATRLQDRIESDEALVHLARSPLSLALLVLLEHARGELPAHRVHLYEAFADELLRRRPSPPVAHLLDPTEFLIPLALWFQRDHPIGRVSADALAEECLRIALRYEGYMRIEDASPAERTIAATRARNFYSSEKTEAASGILSETSPGVLSFVHRALQDFYVGRSLARMPSDSRWELLQPRLHAARWREPLLLCAGWLAVVERRRDEIDTLCRQLLDANSRDEWLLARDTRLGITLASHSGGLVRHQRLGEMLQRMERFAAAMPSAGARKLWLRSCAQLTRLGSSTAEAALSACITDGFPDLRQAAIDALHGLLDTASMSPLLALVLESLAEGPDIRERFAAWHVLLPLWHRSSAARTALITTLQASGGPPCSNGAYEVVERAQTGDPELLQRLAEDPAVRAQLVIARIAAGTDPKPLRPQIRELFATITYPSLVLGTLLKSSVGNPALQAEIDALLTDPDPQIRHSALLMCVDPSRGLAIEPIIERGLADPEPAVREAAERLAVARDLHRPGGLVLARELLASDTDRRNLMLHNLRGEWWSDRKFQEQFLGLLSTAAPEVASNILLVGFPRIFSGQPELVAAAIAAFDGDISELHGPALEAITPHLHAVPPFAATLLTAVHRRDSRTTAILHGLRRIIDADRDAQQVVCALATDDHAPVPFREAALDCLNYVAHHAHDVWTTVRTLVELGATELTPMYLVGVAHTLLLKLAEYLPGEALRRGIVLLDGQRAGLLEETPSGTRFTYDDAWLSSADAMAISLTMPLRAHPYESTGLHPFFDNMLPEGWLLGRISLADKIDKRDRLGILLATGGDAIGAVSVIPDDAEEDDA